MIVIMILDLLLRFTIKIPNLIMRESDLNTPLHDYS